MIKANLENGVSIILKNGAWSCDDPKLAEMLNSSQNYWRAKEKGDYQSTVNQDNIAAAKVLAQFGGEVSCITLDV